MYKHEENQLDPRDKALVTYSPKSKRFIVEASSLKGSGIEPQFHQGVLGSYYYLWLWSEKLQTSILYKEKNAVKSPDGEIIANVFIPDFTMITTDKELKARSLSKETELHILND